LDDSTITSNRDKLLRFWALINPLNFPNNISMFVVMILCRSDGLQIIRPDVEYSNITLRITDGDQMRLLFGEHARGNTVLPFNDFLRECVVFQCPESQNTGLELLIFANIDIKFTITDGNQIRVSLIDIHA
jgi:hypothetical protein